jgi:hypothetical protein
MIPYIPEYSAATYLFHNQITPHRFLRVVHLCLHSKRQNLVAPYILPLLLLPTLLLLALVLAVLPLLALITALLTLPSPYRLVPFVLAIIFWLVPVHLPGDSLVPIPRDSLVPLALVASRNQH